MVLLALLVLAVSAVGIALLAGYGWQSLRQARLLRQAVPLGDLADHEGRVVAVTGRAEALEPTSDPLQTLWVWVETEHVTTEVVLGGPGARRRRRTKSGRTLGFDFRLRAGDDDVLVRAAGATEVHGTVPVGGPGDGMKRRGLRVGDRIAACGRLARLNEGRLTVTSDDEAGLLLTSLRPTAQASIEALKGWTSVAVLPAVWVAAFGWFLVASGV